MRKPLKVLAIVLITFLLIVGIIIWGIQTPTGQGILTTQVNSYLRKKLKSNINIEKIRFDIPDWIVLEGVFISDLQGDTLLAGKNLRVDLDMYALIKGNIGINTVELTGINAHIKRTLPDTTFNFQFIVDAFVGEPSVDTVASSPLEMRLDKIILKDVKLSYRDAVIGTDASTVIDSAFVAFTAFNPTTSTYHPEKVFLQNSQAKLRLYEALQVSVVETISDPADSLNLKLGEISINKFKWSFVDETTGLKNGIELDQLKGKINKIYVASQFVDVGDIFIKDMKTFASFDKKPQDSNKSKKNVSDSITKPTSPGWTAKLADLHIENNSLQYDDFNQPRLPKGMDYSHLNISNLNIRLKDFIFSDENIAGILKSANFSEKSGFTIKELTTDFAYGSKETYLKKLFLKTNNSTLRDELILRYKSIKELSNDLSKVEVVLNLKNSTLGFADILTLVPDLDKTPPFEKNKDGSVSGTANLKGTVDNLQIAQAKFKMIDGTVVNIDGNIKGLPNPDKLIMRLNLNEIATTKADLQKMLPDSSLPSSIELPDSIRITGKINGSIANLALVTNISTSFGQGTFSGTLKNITDSVKAEYDGTLRLNEFDMGKLLKQPTDELGKITLLATLSGNGYALNTMQANLQGNVDDASIKGYNYQNLALTGNINNGLVNLNAKINDSNIQLNVDGQADVNGEYPIAKGEINIDKLDLRALNLYADELEIKGNTKFNFQSTNPENPIGEINIADLQVTHQGKPIPVGAISMKLSDSLSVKSAKIVSSFVNMNMVGDFQYSQLSDVIFTEIGKHIQSPALAYNQNTTPTNFQIDATISYHPVIQAFVPELKKLDPVSIQAKINNQIDSSIVATINIPFMDYDSIRTEQIAVKFYTTDQKAQLSSKLGLLSTGGFRMQNASLNGDISNNNIVFDFIVRDSIMTERHALRGDVEVSGTQYKLKLRKGLLLDYQEWDTNTEGSITYAPDSVWIKDISILNKKQALTINSTSVEPNSALNIGFKEIAIGPLIGIAMQDTTLATGTLNGEMVLRDYLKTPIFSGEFNLTNLAVIKIPLGDLKVSATNEKENEISIDMSLIGEGNTVKMSGNYKPKEKENLDFLLDLEKFDGKTVEAFSLGELKEASGYLTGKTKITGSTDSPKLNGDITFKDFKFKVAQLGSRYTLSDQNITFKNYDILFNNFILKDSLDQKLTINGKANIASIPDVAYDLKVETKNFVALNSTQQDNEMFFGKALINALISVKGKGSNAIIDGNLKINKGSNITYVMLDKVTETGNVNEGLIKFVDKSLNEEETGIEKIKVEESTKVDFASEISMDIEVDDKSQFTVVIDELNGDNIKLKGNAQLTTGVAPNGEFFMLGAYDVTEGSYDITLEILKRKFDILKGSTLIWSGDPLKADLNITAYYTVFVDPATISSNLKGAKKVPIDVQVIITGNLSSPTIAFNVEPSQSIIKTDVASDITNQPFWKNMKNSASELNKQAFALLLTNRFLSDQSSSPVNLNSSAEAIARQSVSQLLSDQLNNLASDLVKGVDVDLDLNSTTDQTAGARTDLNVGVSKAFLNNRLKISVGKNFELENSAGSSGSSEVFDNIALDYSLSRDGRYLFRAFRRNQYQSILEGFIIETGVSFIVTADYDLLSEFFKRQKNDN